MSTNKSKLPNISLFVPSKKRHCQKSDWVSSDSVIIIDVLTGNQTAKMSSWDFSGMMPTLTVLVRTSI